jgi:arachidonate 15-lipoxygenase (second type) / 8-lipoxygenase (S-type)
MLQPWCLVLWTGFICDVFAIPVVPRTIDRPQRRADNSSVVPFSLPPPNDEGSPRAQAIEYKRQNFLYGPALAGGGPFFPAGPLGNLTVYGEVVQDGEVLLTTGEAVDVDEAKALAAIEQVFNKLQSTFIQANYRQAGGIKSLSDYNILYKGQWVNSVPEGVDSGMLSNYTQDLLFSMERLSTNPYSIIRLQNTGDGLPFTIDDAIAKNLTGITLEELYTRGHLFYADNRVQANLTKTARYTAACDAYFYIHPESGDFLPLAIRPNAGSNLIYTPLDQPNDWLLAKVMFTTNDLWYGQLYHFAGTHSIVEIVNEAAIRSLSDDHPILAIVNRSKRLFVYNRPS